MLRRVLDTMVWKTGASMEFELQKNSHVNMDPGIVQYTLQKKKLFLFHDTLVVLAGTFG